MVDPDESPPWAAAMAYFVYQPHTRAMTTLRPATAELRPRAPAYPARDSQFGNLHDAFDHYASMYNIESERPWSRPEQTWTSYSQMRGTTGNLLRLEPSATRELTTPFHLTSTNPSHAATTGLSMFTRRGRGATDYSRPQTAAVGARSSAETLHLEHTPQSASQSFAPLHSATLRTMRIEARNQGRSFERPAPISPPSKIDLRDKKLSQPAPWADPMKAGLGYAEKFHYRH